MAGHVFVCYSRKDTEFVLILVKELKEYGIPIWLDQWDIPPSANWNRTRDKALYDAAQCLVVLSPAAVESEQVEAEWVTGLEERKPVVPILYQACQIPSRLRLIQRFDFIKSGLKDEATMKALVRTLGGSQQAPIVQPQNQSPAVGQKPESPHNNIDHPPVEYVSIGQAPHLRSMEQQTQSWQDRETPQRVQEQESLLFSLDGKLNRERFTAEAFRALVAATAESQSVGDWRIEVFHVLMSLMRGTYLKGFYQYMTRDTGKELDTKLKIFRGRIRQAYRRPVVEEKSVVREFYRVDGASSVLALLNNAVRLAGPGLIEEKHLLTALLREAPLELLPVLQESGLTLANLQRYIRESR